MRIINEVQLVFRIRWIVIHWRLVSPAFQHFPIVKFFKAHRTILEGVIHWWSSSLIWNVTWVSTRISILIFMVVIIRTLNKRQVGQLQIMVFARIYIWSRLEHNSNLMVLLVNLKDLPKLPWIFLEPWVLKTLLSWGSIYSLLLKHQIKQISALLSSLFAVSFNMILCIHMHITKKNLFCRIPRE